MGLVPISRQSDRKILNNKALYLRFRFLVENSAGVQGEDGPSPFSREPGERKGQGETGGGLAPCKGSGVLLEKVADGGGPPPPSA